mgnify:FL=1
MLAAGIESGGTLFLDEIANITPGQQAKLLRVLSTGELERVGSSKSRRVDVRVLAATNVDPRPEVAAGRFREDLLYRLNAVGIVIPPLRDRCEDLPVLAAHFLHHHAHRYRKPILGFRPDAMEALLRHGWPGNVRELDHAIERAVLLADAAEIQTPDLSLARHPAEAPQSLDSRRSRRWSGCWFRKRCSGPPGMCPRPPSRWG